MSPTVRNWRLLRSTIERKRSPSDDGSDTGGLRLGEPPHALGGQRQLVRVAAHHSPHGGRDGRADRVQRALAGTLGAVGADAVAALGEDLVQTFRKIAATGHSVIHYVRIGKRLA